MIANKRSETHIRGKGGRSRFSQTAETKKLIGIERTANNRIDDCETTIEEEASEARASREAADPNSEFILRNEMTTNEIEPSRSLRISVEGTAREGGRSYIRHSAPSEIKAPRRKPHRNSRRRNAFPSIVRGSRFNRWLEKRDPLLRRLAEYMKY